MDEEKLNFIKCKRIAVVGVSRINSKFGNTTYRELKNREYEVIPVHSEMKEFDGDLCYQNIQEISPPVEGVFINISPPRVIDVLRDAIKTNINKIWLQQGSESEEAIQFGKDHGLSIASHGCILMYAEPVTSFHALHKWIWKLIKKY